jgi:hypothetical protein
MAYWQAAKNVQVLALDSDLRSSVDPTLRRQATLELEAPLLILDPGEWEPPTSLGEGLALGLLLVDGLIARQVQVSESRCLELLGSGDLLRPWQEDAASFVWTHWQVLTRTRAMLLTTDFTARVCRYPQLVEALVERTIQRSRSLAVHSAIDNVVGLEESLLLLFWHLAERWGRVEPDGVIVPLKLTHQMLADLVGARRPSVTSALKELARSETLTKLDGRGWRLTGSPPLPSPGSMHDAAVPQPRT